MPSLVQVMTLTGTGQIGIFAVRAAVAARAAAAARDARSRENQDEARRPHGEPDSPSVAQLRPHSRCMPSPLTARQRSTRFVPKPDAMK